MMKRRRKSWHRPTTAKKRRMSGADSDSSEDEITAALPDAVVRRLAEDSEDELGGAADRLRARAAAVANGHVTPQSSVSPEKAETQPILLESAEVSEEEDEFEQDSAPPTPRKTNRSLLHVNFPGWEDGPAFPRRLYGWHPKGDTFSESEAISRLLDAYDRQYVNSMEKPEHTYFTLDDFTVYRPADAYGHGLELVALDKLSRDRYGQFCADGSLSFGQERCYVKGVPFATLTVDGYGDDDLEAADMAKQLCIQSRNAQHHNVWYRLRKPAPEYRRFYKPFLWLARFTKHFVDYLLATEQVTISHFRIRFLEWMQETSAGDASHGRWLDSAHLQDFRTTVVANIEFLWKECWGTQDPKDEINILNHPLWGEVHPARLSAIPEEPNWVQRTVVTPFTAHCFRSMYFADQFLETTVTDATIRDLIDRLKAKLGLPPMRDRMSASLPTPLSVAEASPEPTSISVGDVVAVRPEQDGKWKSVGSSWYAYVQRIRKDTASNTRLDVIWLYQAEDTTIGKTPYRYENELFFSDNCDCGKDALYLDCVVGKVNVTWFSSDGEVVQGLFAWRKFRTVPEMDQYDYVLLKESDFRCHHQPDHTAEPTHEYALGDTVLVQKPKDSRGRNCDPAQVIGFSANKSRVQLRRFLRPEGLRAPNELLPTPEVVELETRRIVRQCHVQVFTQQQIDAGRIPTPYDRDGAGDFFYIANSDDLQDSSISFPPMNLGWNPQESPPSKRKLTGLGIFCGGGTFDRGLEEGGAVQFRYAVDWSQKALHSYRANATHDVNFFLGSVDDYLAKAMAGQLDDNVARPGDVQVISAGSPCQGFSRLQLSTASPESKKNASMVASVVSFVDFCVPEYLILENVVSMTESIKERKEHNVFSQIIAALVGLGYQVQQFLTDSWSYGSSQQRSRVFIIATAPSSAPLVQPECTHAHPTKHFRVRKLGKSSNGLPFGTRKENPFVPFPFVTAEQAVSDLPSVYDGLPQICPKFPDHRAQLETLVNRERIAAVPTRPRGHGLVQAKKAGKLRGKALEYFDGLNNRIRSNDNSKSYARCYPDHLFPTIVTKLAISDGINGRTLHWDQHRALTLMETRRAQGYLDHEVLVGSHADQMKIVGNSVDRKVALVLGLALRQSWLQSRSGVDAEDAVESLTDMLDPATHDHDEDLMAAGSAVDNMGTTNEMDTATHIRHESSDTERSGDVEIIDNRLVKISLVLTQEEIAEVRKSQQEQTGADANARAVKQILRIMDSRKHRAARQSLHRADGKSKAAHA